MSSLSGSHRVTSMTPLSYAAIAGGQGSPTSRDPGKAPQNDRRSPRRVFTLKSKINTTTPKQSATEEMATTSTSDPKPAQQEKQQSPKPSLVLSVSNEQSALVSQSSHAETGQQKGSTTLTMNWTQERKVPKMLQKSKDPATSASTSASELTAVQDRSKSKADAEPTQNISTLEFFADGHYSEDEQPSSWKAQEKKPLPTLEGTEATQYADIHKDLQAMIQDQNQVIAGYQAQMSMQSREIKALQDRVDGLETSLASKTGTQLQEHLGKFKDNEKQKQIQKLETMCTVMTKNLEYMKTLLGDFKTMQEDGQDREVDLRTENTKLRNIIKTGVLSIADVWGEEAAASFTNMAEKMNGNGSSHAHTTSYKAQLISSSHSKGSSQNEGCSEAPTGECQRSTEDPFVQDPADIGSVEHKADTLSSTSESASSGNKKDAVDRDHVNKIFNMVFHSATGTWADEMEEEEEKKRLNQLQPPQDVARAEEKPQDQVKAPQQVARKYVPPFLQKAPSSTSKPSIDAAGPSQHEYTTYQSAGGEACGAYVRKFKDENLLLRRYKPRYRPRVLSSDETTGEDEGDDRANGYSAKVLKGWRK
ncbi:hypothetical protein F4810DRAFT_725298 [Camillea tinctor]|nr:hypothetical protein F4810DRAFT_725298 [Camillea tinctor]